MLRRQPFQKPYFSKVLGESCFDANSACTARARVRRQGIEMIVQLLHAVPIVGINELHPAHLQTYEDGVRKELSDSCCYGSLGGNALFWRRPQRGTGTDGGGQ